MVEIKGMDAVNAALADIAKRFDVSGTVQVGFMEDAKYPDGTSVAMVAALNEYGTAKIPPRPFFRGMIQDDSPNWGKVIEASLVSNGANAANALGVAGEHIKGALQLSIRNLKDPANAASTIKKKGFDDPLIDTGQMLKSVTYKVDAS